MWYDRTARESRGLLLSPQNETPGGPSGASPTPPCQGQHCKAGLGEHEPSSSTPIPPRRRDCNCACTPPRAHHAQAALAHGDAAAGANPKPPGYSQQGKAPHGPAPNRPQWPHKQGPGGAPPQALKYDQLIVRDGGSVILLCRCICVRLSGAAHITGRLLAF